MLKLLLRLTASGIALSALSACGTLVTLDELSKPAVADSLTFPSDVFYTFQGDKPVAERYYGGLLAGRYTAEWVDARGTYYRGPNEAVVWADDPANQLRHVAQGGLFIAKGDASPRYTMYRYLGTEKLQSRRGVPGAPAAPAGDAVQAPRPTDNLIWPLGAPTSLQSGLATGIGMAIVEMSKDVDNGKIALQKPPTPVGTFEDKFTRP